MKTITGRELPVRRGGVNVQPEAVLGFFQLNGRIIRIGLGRHRAKMGRIQGPLPAVDAPGRLEAEFPDRGLGVADAQEILVMGLLQAPDLSHGRAEDEFGWIVHLVAHILYSERLSLQMHAGAIAESSNLGAQSPFRGRLLRRLTPPRKDRVWLLAHVLDF